MTFYTGYPTEPIGGGNPYYQCKSCGRAEPEINGTLEGHREWCSWRVSKEVELETTIPGITAREVIVRGDDLQDLEYFKRFFLRRKPTTFYGALEVVQDWGQSSTSAACAIDNIFQADGKHIVRFEY